MSERIKIQFYKISRCGYYQLAADSPEFGGIHTVLSQLQDWVNEGGKVLSDTCTYEVTDSDGILKSYCFDVSSLNRDFLITIWNQTPDNEGRVVSVNGNQPVGDANINFISLPDDAIPGYATYFWFIPDRNVFAVIRFNNSVMISKNNLEKYLKEFICKFTDFVVYEDNDSEEGEILGYTDSDGSEPLPLRGDFKAYLYKKPGKTDYILSNFQDIRKVINKNELFISNQDDRNLIQRFKDKLSMETNFYENGNGLEIKYEMPYIPASRGEVEHIIDQWNNSGYDSNWDDIGFNIRGDSGTHWLSHSIAKDELEIDVERENDEIINNSSLLEALVERRDLLLRLLDS